MLEVGNVVYVYSKTDELIYRATIAATDNCEINVRYDYPVDEDGKLQDECIEACYCGITVRIPICEMSDEELQIVLPRMGIWCTAKEAYNVVSYEKTERYKRLYNEIKNIQDLLRFPLCYCKNSEGIDFVALKVYKDKAKELLGAVI